MINQVWAGLTGRYWIAVPWACSLGITVTGLIIFGLWIAAHRKPIPVCWPRPLVVVILSLLRFGAAVLVARLLLARKLMTFRALMQFAVVWTVAAAWCSVWPAG